MHYVRSALLMLVNQPGITAGMALIAWRKNNSVTKHAQAADKHIKELKKAQ